MILGSGLVLLLVLYGIGGVFSSRLPTWPTLVGFVVCLGTSVMLFYRGAPWFYIALNLLGALCWAENYASFNINRVAPFPKTPRSDPT